MPTTLILGGNGKVARHLTRLLVSSGHKVHSLIRSPTQFDSIKALGAEPVVQSLEDSSVADLVQTIHRSGPPDTIVWAAGAGGGSPERTESVDHLGAIKAMDAAHEAGVRRFVLVSALDVRDREKGWPSWYDEDDKKLSDRVWGAIGVYMEAKFKADRELVTGNAKRKLQYTIVRPGGLSEDPGKGTVEAGKVHIGGMISREDVAKIVAEVIEEPKSIGLVFDVKGGNTPIKEALQKVVDEKADSFEGYY